jgi:hypothetical protein
MLQAVGDHPQGECLHARDGFIPVSAVTHHSGQCGNFGQPAAIVLTLEFDRKGHPGKVAPGLLSNKRLQPTAAGAIMSRCG